MAGARVPPDPEEHGMTHDDTQDGPRQKQTAMLLIALVAIVLLFPVIPLAASARAPDSDPRQRPTCGGLAATHVGTAGNDTIYGTPRRDVIVARGGADQVYGRGGNDVICAGGGRDDVEGGPGADRIWGQGGRDDLEGQRGHDRVLGGPGRDEVYGQAGNDTLNGGPGNDRCFNVERRRGC
jgi:hypothetical protein